LSPHQLRNIGANYVSDHANPPPNEVNHSVSFSSTYIACHRSKSNVKIPMEIKFESELAVVIDRAAKNITPSEVSQYIFGNTICKDVTTPQLTHDEGY